METFKMGDDLNVKLSLAISTEAVTGIHIKLKDKIIKKSTLYNLKLLLGNSDTIENNKLHVAVTCFVKENIDVIMEKCSDKHKDELLKTIKKSAGENCFLYGDIENYSLDSDFMDVWRIVKGDIITSIVLRYYTNYVIYSTDSTDYKNISEIINTLLEK